MVGMKDENLVHRVHDHRIGDIIFRRDREGHAQEVGGVGQVVARIDEGLTHRIFIRHRRDCRHLGDQAVAGDLALHRIVDVGRIMVEGRQRADHADQDRHGMRVAAEATEESRQLFMHHGVARDGAGEVGQFVGGRQFAVQQQIADFHEAGFFGELADGIAAMQQDAFVAVDIGQA